MQSVHELQVGLLPDIPLSGLKFRQRTGALLDLYFDLLLSRFLGFGE